MSDPGQDPLAEALAFMRERLDEEAAAAIAAGGDAWQHHEHPSDTGLIRDAAGGVVVYDEGEPSEEQAEHIARWDPARVLADVAAKRAIVDMHETCGTGSGYCDDGGHGYSDGLGCGILDYLAQPYAQHPDWQQDWHIPPTPDTPR